MLMSIVEWLTQYVTELVELVVQLFIGALDLDLSVYVDTFPLLPKAYSLFQYLAMGLLVIIAGMGLVQFALNPVNEREWTDRPITILFRSAMAAALIFFGGYLLELVVNIAKIPYGMFAQIDAVDTEFITGTALLNGVVSSAVGAEAVTGGGFALLALILIGLIGWNIFKLIIEVAERFMYVGVLFFFAPLFYPTLATSKTSQIFKKWVSSFISSCILMAVSVFFLKLVLSGFSGFSEDGSDYVVRLLMILAVCQIAKRSDNLMNQLGLSTPLTGAGLVQDLMSLKLLTGHRGGSGGGAAGTGSVLGQVFKNSPLGRTVGAVHNTAMGAARDLGAGKNMGEVVKNAGKTMGGGIKSAASVTPVARAVNAGQKAFQERQQENTDGNRAQTVKNAAAAAAVGAAAAARGAVGDFANAYDETDPRRAAAEKEAKAEQQRQQQKAEQDAYRQQQKAEQEAYRQQQKTEQEAHRAAQEVKNNAEANSAAYQADVDRYRQHNGTSVSPDIAMRYVERGETAPEKTARNHYEAHGLGTADTGGSIFTATKGGGIGLTNQAKAAGLTLQGDGGHGGVLYGSTAAVSEAVASQYSGKGIYNPNPAEQEGANGSGPSRAGETAGAAVGNTLMNTVEADKSGRVSETALFDRRYDLAGNDDLGDAMIHRAFEDAAPKDAKLTDVSAYNRADSGTLKGGREVAASYADSDGQRHTVEIINETGYTSLDADARIEYVETRSASGGRYYVRDIISEEKPAEGADRPRGGPVEPLTGRDADERRTPDRPGDDDGGEFPFGPPAGKPAQAERHTQDTPGGGRPMRPANNGGGKRGKSVPPPRPNKHRDDNRM